MFGKQSQKLLVVFVLQKKKTGRIIYFNAKLNCKAKIITQKHLKIKGKGL